MTKMNKRSFLYILLGIYFLIAVGNVGYNGLKTYTEVRDWYFLSDTQKREKIFGDLYTAFLFIDKNTVENASLLIVSSDVRAFFLGRYYLYPKKITVVATAKELAQQALPEYVASIGSSLKLKGYMLIKTKGNVFLYKRGN